MPKMLVLYGILRVKLCFSHKKLINVHGKQARKKTRKWQVKNCVDWKSATKSLCGHLHHLHSEKKIILN